VHEIASASLPDWIKKAQTKLRQLPKRVGILLFAIDSPESSGVAAASNLVTDSITSGFGLGCQSNDGPLLIFPPGYSPPKPCRSKSENGHIPSWLRNRLSGGGFSDYLTKCFARFQTAYARLTRVPPAYEKECDILIKLAKDIARGDVRLFYPLARLQVLAEWEAARANTRARDHFFHTFNNLLTGFILLRDLFTDRGDNECPDCFIAQPANIGELKGWEALWFLTCLFHDPGYVGERFWSTVSFSVGVESASPSDPIPESVATLIRRAWKDDYAEARKDLLELFKRICGSWAPASAKTDVAERFDAALEVAFFDGKVSSHSLLSGLTLIKRCLTDTTPKHARYNHFAALAACEIAGLSMMFHDQNCRQKLRECGLDPIPFESLPYAGMLMYVDALQEDRRDISRNRFLKHGVLQSVRVDPQSSAITADLCLRDVPTRYWPYKISEYQSVTTWLNARSNTRFLIDYTTRIGMV
jgi:hypothetical protein